MLCVVILYVSGGTYSLKSTPNDRFEKLFILPCKAFPNRSYGFDVKPGILLFSYKANTHALDCASSQVVILNKKNLTDDFETLSEVIYILICSVPVESIRSVL